MKTENEYLQELQIRVALVKFGSEDIKKKYKDFENQFIALSQDSRNTDDFFKGHAAYVQSMKEIMQDAMEIENALSTFRNQNEEIMKLRLTCCEQVHHYYWNWATGVSTDPDTLELYANKINRLHQALPSKRDYEWFDKAFDAKINTILADAQSRCRVNIYEEISALLDQLKQSNISLELQNSLRMKHISRIKRYVFSLWLKALNDNIDYEHTFTLLSDTYEELAKAHINNPELARSYIMQALDNLYKTIARIQEQPIK